MNISTSLEIIPPKQVTPLFIKTMDTFSHLKPRFVSVVSDRESIIHGVGVDKLLAIKNYCKTPVAAHLTCRGKTKQQINKIAEKYWESGVRHIIALHGEEFDHERKHIALEDTYNDTIDFISGLKKIAPFEISVSGYPETHPYSFCKKSDIEFIKRKVDAGADRIITQFFFDDHYFLNYKELLQNIGISIPIIPGILPIINFDWVVDFSNKNNIYIPCSLYQLFSKAREENNAQELTVRVASRLCKSLYDQGVYDFHFFTLNSPLISKIYENLMSNIMPP